MKTPLIGLWSVYPVWIRAASCLLMMLGGAAWCNSAETARRGPPTASTPGSIVISNRQEWELGMALGASTNAIVKKLGLPGWEDPLTNGVVEWYYGVRPFPAEGEMQGGYVTGVKLGFTNSALAGWSYIYVFGPRKSLPAPPLPDLVGLPPTRKEGLRFYLVHDGPLKGGKLFDSVSFPRLGYIAAKPDLLIEHIQSYTEEITDGAPFGERLWTFGIFFRPTDMAALNSMISTNLFRRLLLLVDNKPICAPRMVGEILAGELQIQCTNQEPASLLARELKRLQAER